MITSTVNKSFIEIEKIRMILHYLLCTIKKLKRKKNEKNEWKKEKTIKKILEKSRKFWNNVPDGRVSLPSQM